MYFNVLEIKERERAIKREVEGKGEVEGKSRCKLLEDREWA